MPRKSRKLFKLKFTKTRLIFLAILLLLTLGGGGLAWARYNDDASSDSSDEATSSNDEGSQDNPNINLSPPTEQEVSATEDYKRELSNQQNSTQNSSGKKQVTPVIVSADKYGANAYVPGIYEDGGTCTATFTHGADKITATSEGFKNVSYTSCAPMTLTGPLNIKGTWSVTVSYSSASAAGQSAAKTFEVD